MRLLTLSCSLVAFTAACSTPPSAGDEVDAPGNAPGPAPRAEPLVPEWNDTGSVWDHIASSYDADGDGSVSPAEYTRDERAFARLDRDADGFLTAVDFPDESESMAMLRTRLARSVVERYLQDDDVSEELTIDELFVAAEVYDRDGDELLVEEEFRAQADERRQEVPASAELRMMGTFDPWEALVDGVDDDGDGAVAFAELGAFFETNDHDADFVWTMEPVEADYAPGLEPGSGPKVGTLAPDFELAPPHGGAPVRLSSFRGKRPVALVFGSAT